MTTIPKQTIGRKPASKYTMKRLKRERAARAIGLPINTPWPIIWMKQEEQKEKAASMGLGTN